VGEKDPYPSSQVIYHPTLKFSGVGKGGREKGKIRSYNPFLSSFQHLQPNNYQMLLGDL
jgi:hypothetical protein